MAEVVSCSAPGKLVLLGEYAVLLGHPAVVAAVDRRARVAIRPSDGSTWRVTAPGWWDREESFELAAGGELRWAGPPSEVAARWALVEQVTTWLSSTGVDPVGIPPASLTLDTRAFFELRRGATIKLGLGSSAALTVALAAALARWSGAVAPTLEDLLGLHRRFQGGRGSGVDLAASLLGGVLEYRIDDSGRGATAAPLALPAGLRSVVVWTGRSVSTAAYLARLDERLAARDQGVLAALGELGGAARSGVGHLRAGAPAGWLDDVDRHWSGLEALGRAAGLDILSDAHRELRGLAADAGVRYKPSGAGGGDVGVGFTDDAAAAARFARAVDDAGYSVLQASTDPVGLSREAAGA